VLQWNLFDCFSYELTILVKQSSGSSI